MSALGIDIDRKQIVLLPPGVSKHDALDQLIDAVAANPAVTDTEAFREAVHERERISSTGIGHGIAIPHVRIPEVTSATIGIGIAAEGIEFDTLDNKPVHVLVLFATPASGNKEYLALLSRVMMALRRRELFDTLVTCTTEDEVGAVLEA